MKKYLKFLPQVLFAAGLLFIGAIGKLTGAEPAVAMFQQINLFEQGEAFGRILVGLTQLFAAIGVFFRPTRKIAALAGIVTMIGAIYFHLTLFGGTIIMPVIVLLLGAWIFIKGGCGCCGNKCGSKNCTSGTCSVEEPESHESTE
ncbi:hypothetical protein CL684_01185 [Candidatus Campbellbacteria bacterium]|mgnify:CR=1 FL=1|nr:hypothetical protein [Candidatus Campbellbacteria bacterium]|tara:strand:- start:1742 stop:2176 length:435 start_codon:yes stop_codon:yes gene_type:complete